MTSSINNGFLVVADITGYTVYLSESELDHAGGVLKTLMDLLIDSARAPLAVSGLEGDAVLSYSIDSGRFEGQTFIEMIEQTYVAFKRAIDLMVMNTSCECNACANIGALDLKFFVHHGEFMLQKLSRSEELVGSDVNLIHRIMKNNVVKDTGFRAYTLYTEAAIAQLDLDNAKAGLTAHEESFADVGAVTGWVMNMTPIWEASKDKAVIPVPRGAIRFVEEYPLPPEQLWGYLTNPEYRQVFSNARRQVTANRRNGRVGLGTVYECFHMDNTTSTNTVLEWQPFSRIVSENTVRASNFIAIYELEPIETGTRVTMRFGPLQGPAIDKVIGLPTFLLKGKRHTQEGMANLRKLIEDDITAGRVLVPDSAVPADEDRTAAIDAALGEVAQD